MLRKSIAELSKRQRELLLEIWITAHNAHTHARQVFTYKVVENDEAEWDGLISANYLERIPKTEDHFMLSSETEDIYNELITKARMDKEACMQKNANVAESKK